MSTNYTVGSTNSVQQAAAAQINSHSRVREPVSRSKGRVVGFYCSLKNKRGVAWESQLEMKACCLFEFSKSVSFYREQPVSVWLPSKPGALRKYTPDFALHDEAGQLTYVEVKPKSQLSDPEVMETLQAAAKHFESRGHRYLVLTDEELNLPTVIPNLVVLKAYLKHMVEPALIELVSQYLSEQRFITFAELIELVGSRQIALILIARQMVYVDFSQPLTAATIITLNQENSHENYLFKGRFAPYFE